MVGDKHTRAALHTYFPCTLYKVVLSGINSPSQCTRQHEAYFQNNGRGISYTGYKITEKRLQFVTPTQTIFFKKQWGGTSYGIYPQFKQNYAEKYKIPVTMNYSARSFFSKKMRGAFHVYPTQTIFFKKKWGGGTPYGI